jgi:glyoxylase-like metal-dependent hydrolase (beta-lactamase superfamily II)
MAGKPVVPGVYEVSLGFVNAFLLEADDGLTLIDTGIPGSEGAILEAVGALGRRPEDVRHVVVTHCHSDHSGSLAALKRATGAAAWMHPEDASMVRSGRTLRPLVPAPGPLNAMILERALSLAPAAVEPAAVEHEVRDGDALPVAGGLTAVHVPGHCAGQLALLWPRHGGVLFAADAAANVSELALSPGYEDLAEGMRGVAKLAALEFAVACFGHGHAIVGRASERFRRNWGGRGQDQGQGAA